MEFRLVYNGLLLGASRGDTRSAHKHEIRKVFHGQLKTLWEKSPNLRNWVSWEMDKNRTMRERLAEAFAVNGINYLPLSWGKSWSGMSVGYSDATSRVARADTHQGRRH